ncbi:GDCCVxC domain-containing (seleno)protein [Sphingobium fluviale]|uniref:Uncharacterized protein n=1 Tax=Sphingobium fluviale TaxID=2506423 RepID=A0A4Q1KCY8_9SPHN|nr:GDCCVxC domain-containing (seleno)protein [Sphingobium fluviale]RXR25199.1 hypothetical protein EQG66_14420 [Sphingobium fluviale]
MSDRVVVFESALRCPVCGVVKVETMPTDACWYFYDCSGCGVVLKPKPGDCCVFCSYGTVPCPPVQLDGKAADCCAPSCANSTQSGS